jgi:hypothetical protein
MTTPSKKASAREIVFAAILAGACALIISGVWILSEAAGRITGGLLIAGWSWLVLSDTEVGE